MESSAFLSIRSWLLTARSEKTTLPLAEAKIDCPQMWPAHSTVRL